MNDLIEAHLKECDLLAKAVESYMKAQDQRGPFAGLGRVISKAHLTLAYTTWSRSVQNLKDFMSNPSTIRKVCSNGLIKK